MAKQPSQLEMLYNASSKPQDIVNNPMFNNYMRTVQYPELFNHLSKGGSMVTLPNKPAPLSMSGMPPAVQNIMSQSTTSSAPPKITFPNVKKTSTSTTKPASTNKVAVAKPTTTNYSKPVSAAVSAPAKTTVTIRQVDGTTKTGYIDPKDNLTYYDDGTRVTFDTGAVSVVKGNTTFNVKGAKTPSAGGAVVASAGTTGGTGAGAPTGGAVKEEAKAPAAATETPAEIYLPNPTGGYTRQQGYVRGGVTYYKDANNVEQRAPINAVVNAKDSKGNDRYFQRGETGGTKLEGDALNQFLAALQAGDQINQQVKNTENFVTRLEANRNQAITGAERQAEMARQGMQNQMFQDWLGVRQAMTNRGLTGSGIAEDANTRLAMAQQQQLANLFTGLSTQINEINQNADLTKQEKEQQILDLQNSYNDLQRQIASGMTEQQLKQAQTQAEIAKAQSETTRAEQQARLDWAKVFGVDPETGIATQAAKEFEASMDLKLKEYGLSVADVTGYMPSTDANGNTIYVPTLERQKFLDKQATDIRNRNDRIYEFNQQMLMAGQKAQAEAFNNKVQNIEGGLTNLMDYTKSVYDATYKAYSDIPDKKSDEAVEAYDTMQGAFDQWISTGAQYAQFNKDPLNYVDNVSNKKASSTGMAPSANKKNIGDFLTDWSQYM